MTKLKQWIKKVATPTVTNKLWRLKLPQMWTKLWHNSICDHTKIWQYLNFEEQYYRHKTWILTKLNGKKNLILKKTYIVKENWNCDKIKLYITQYFTKLKLWPVNNPTNCWYEPRAACYHLTVFFVIYFHIGWFPWILDIIRNHEKKWFVCRCLALSCF